MAVRPILAASAAALALAGCQGAHNGASASGGGSNLCTPFPGATASATTAAGAPATAAPLATADPATAMEDCLHRWGYALAGSRDDATHVAQATLAACQSVLVRWNQQTASMGGPGAPPIEAPSLVTGQTTSPIGQHLAFSQDRALFYVVQARAGHCAAPPMANGVPVGLSRD
jgi:hypothetical protein